MVIKFIRKKFKYKKRPADRKMIDHKKDLITKLVKGEKESPKIIRTSIKDIMSTDLKTLNSDDNIGYVLELFSEYSITGAPVVDKEKIVGIVSETDIIRLMNQKTLFNPKTNEVKIYELQKIKVKGFMAKNVFFVNQNEKITEGSRIMDEKGVHRLLVLDNKKGLVGIITMEDIIMGLSAEFFVDSIQKATDKVIGSEIDTLLEIIQKRREITIDELVKELNLKQNHIENLAKILEKRGLIRIDYTIFGSPILKVKS